MPASLRAGRPLVLGTTRAAARTLTVAPGPADASASAAGTGAATAPATTATTATVDRPTNPRLAKVRHAYRVARHQLGDPYAYGRTGPGAFDCSGLTWYAFHKRAHFRHFPRTSAAQARFAHGVRRSHLRKGDLVFFTDGGRVYHAAIFAGWRHGHRVVLHAPYPGARVRIDRIWTNHWFARTLRH
jgi:cell wall-associated NlpC family hydrolase